jgi:hypothetical protein
MVECNLDPCLESGKDTSLTPYSRPFAPRRGPEVFLRRVESGVYQAGSEYGVDICVL